MFLAYQKRLQAASEETKPGAAIMRMPKVVNRANRGEFFATSMQPVERLPEYVRMVFFSDQQTVSIVIPVAAFARIAWLMASCPDCVLH